MWTKQIYFKAFCVSLDEESDSDQEDLEKQETVSNLLRAIVLYKEKTKTARTKFYPSVM